MSPPTIATPSGSRSSEPTPWPNASGTPPSSAAIVVMMIGRKRRSEACSIASRAGRPWERCASSAKSIIMMAFFMTIPINRIMPISAMTESSRRTSRSASNAPSPAEGKVERIVIGWIQLSYSTEHDVDGDDRRQDQERLVGQGRLEPRLDARRQTDLARDPVDRLHGGAQRDAGCQVEGDRHGRELALVAHGERSGVLLDGGQCRQRHLAAGSRP